MRETFPVGKRITGGNYRTCCRACGRSYFWQSSLGNRRCPHCRRAVPVAERPLLPAEEQAARALVAREAGGER